jgi:flagellin
MIAFGGSVSALRMQSSLQDSTRARNNSIERLSSGKRVNRAADDAASLSISTRLQSQVRSNSQLVRNVNDNISLLQVMDGGMQQIVNLMQRGRELAVQAANATLSSNDRTALQAELSQIISQIDTVSEQTQFNGIAVLQNSRTTTSSTTTTTTTAGTLDTSSFSDEELLVYALKRSWLEASEDRIADFFGLSGSGQDLTIKFTNEGVGGTLAYVSSAYYTDGTNNGRAVTLSMTLDLDDFLPVVWPDGPDTGGGIYADRVIAHEMVHALISDQMDTSNMPTWFNEGSAEFIHGPDARISAHKAQLVAGAVGDSLDLWGSASLDYADGAAAVRYMHEQLKTKGANGLKDLMTTMAGLGDSEASGSTLEDGLSALDTTLGGGVLDWTTVADFKTAYVAAVNAGYLDTLDLSNSDTGSIGASDVDGGSSLDASDVIDDTDNPQNDPMTGFNEIWPYDVDVEVSSTTSTTTTTTTGTTSEFEFSTGINADSIALDIGNISSSDLGVSTVSISSQADAQAALSTFDTAINSVTGTLANIGAMSNRMESVSSSIFSQIENESSSLSKVVDLDMGVEMAQFTKASIIQKAAAAIMSQANQQPKLVLQLLHQI